LKLDPLLAGTVFTTLEMNAAEDGGTVKRAAAGTVRFKISTAGAVDGASAAEGAAHRATLAAAAAALPAGAGTLR
jgi:hypothetical protein